MTAPVAVMTDETVRRCVNVDDPQGFGALTTARGVLPLAAVDVDAQIIGTVAFTTLKQTFVNAYAEPLEATYIFPLPDRAAVVRFVMEVNGRRVEGVLDERGQARRTYDAAIQAGKRAAIAEEERPGTFSLRVGNLMPGEHASITLEMSALLPVADGEATYRFPLVVAPRYIPGIPLPASEGQVGDGIAADSTAVPDASRISPPVLLPGMPSPVRLSIRAHVDGAGLPVSKLASSLHAVAATTGELSSIVVTTKAGERLNRDFILRFTLGSDVMHTSVRLASSTRTGDADVVALTVLAPPPPPHTRAKDVVFVLDRSGSMQGWKMVAARRACARMIDALRGTDRFSVLAFDDSIEALPKSSDQPGIAGLVAATDRARFSATEWLATIDARGGTEMADPLLHAANLLSESPARDRVLVFITDGQVGNESQLIKLLGTSLHGARVFALGVDQAVNAGFLNRLTALGGAGEAELIESEDRLDDALARVHRRVDTPALSSVKVTLEGADVVAGETAPARLPDAFFGVPASAFLRVRNVTSGAALVLHGTRPDGSAFVQRYPLVRTGNRALMAAWGRTRLRDLEDRFDIGQEDRGALEREIVRTSLASSVLCRFTAFVAVDSEVVNPGGGGTHVVQPVEAPAGWAETEQTKEANLAPARKRSAAARSAGALDKAARAPGLAAPTPVEHKKREKLADLDDDDGFADMSRDEDDAGAERAPAFAQAAAPLGAAGRGAAVPQSPPLNVETKGGVVEGMARALAEVASIGARPSKQKAPAPVQPVVGALAQEDVVTAGLRALLLALAQPLPAHASALPDRVHATLLELVRLSAELALTGTHTPLRATLLGLVDLLRSAECGATDAQAALVAVEEQLAPHVPGAVPQTKRAFWR